MRRAIPEAFPGLDVADFIDGGRPSANWAFGHGLTWLRLTALQRPTRWRPRRPPIREGHEDAVIRFCGFVEEQARHVLGDREAEVLLLWACSWLDAHGASRYVGPVTRQIYERLTYGPEFEPLTPDDIAEFCLSDLSDARGSLRSAAIAPDLEREQVASSIPDGIRRGSSPQRGR